MATEPFSISQCDDNDEWIVLRGDEVVAGPYYSREAAENERDYRNMLAWAA